MKSLICLAGLLLVGCGPAGAKYFPCHFESGSFQDISSGNKYTIDGIRCAIKSVDQYPQTGCNTEGSLAPSELTYDQVSLALNITKSDAKAGCLPVGQYTCQRYFDPNYSGVAYQMPYNDLIYQCGPQGNFRFKRLQ